MIQVKWLGLWTQLHHNAPTSTRNSAHTPTTPSMGAYVGSTTNTTKEDETLAYIMTDLEEAISVARALFKNMPSEEHEGILMNMF